MNIGKKFLLLLTFLFVLIIGVFLFIEFKKGSEKKLESKPENLEHENWINYMENENLGNYCYIASVFETLKKYKGSFENIAHPAREEILSIFSKIDKEEFENLYEDFHNVIQKLNTKTIKSGSQNDSGEFLVILFNAIANDEMLHCSKIKKDYNEDSDFIKNFIILFMDTGVFSKNYILSTDIFVDIKDDRFSEIVYAVPNTFLNAPKVIIFIYLHTGDSGAHIYSDTFEINSKHTLLLKSSTSNGTYTYNLQAISVHLGSSEHCGHYLTYLKNNNKWEVYSNNSKINLPDDMVCKIPTYLVYERI